MRVPHMVVVGLLLSLSGNTSAVAQCVVDIPNQDVMTYNVPFTVVRAGGEDKRLAVYQVQAAIHRCQSGKESTKFHPVDTRFCERIQRVYAVRSIQVPGSSAPTKEIPNPTAFFPISSNEVHPPELPWRGSEENCGKKAGVAVVEEEKMRQVGRDKIEGVAAMDRVTIEREYRSVPDFIKIEW